MEILDSLQTIQRSWISRVSQRLATGVGIRQSFQEQISRFYDLMEDAVVTGDPDWMNPILDEWVTAHVENEPGERAESLTPILEQIFQISLEVVQEQLTKSQALELLNSLFPIFTHAMRYSSRKESDIYIDQIARRLEEVHQALERLDKTKSDFIAIAAHELKTPLTLIEGYSAMLQDQLSEVEAQILLKGIENGTRRLRDIISDMIDVSMIDNNSLKLNYQPVRIGHMLDFIVAEFQDRVQARGHLMELKEFQGIQEVIFADEERLLQSFRNILANAVKYTPDGGSIIIDGRLLPGFVEITISDTGIGINPADHDIIFEKFGRLGKVSLHSTGKNKFKGGGPGLGLPITKGIIEAHGGTIWVESEAYDEVEFPGTTFHIMLPLTKQAPYTNITEIFRNASDSSNLGDIYSRRLESSE